MDSDIVNYCWNSHTIRRIAGKTAAFNLGVAAFSFEATPANAVSSPADIRASSGLYIQVKRIARA